MIKNYSLFLLAFLGFSFIGFGQSDIIISQYIETDSGTTPKGIEIFNVSGSDINFAATNLDIRQGTNGSSCGSILTVTAGTLRADEVWVLGTNNLVTFANANGTGLSGTTNFDFQFNGDDSLQIWLGGTLQDQFGICGSDPGSAWTGGGVSTANNNLQIKDAICDGDTNGWTNPSERFDQIAGGRTMTGFGNAPASCHTVTSTEVQFSSANYTIGENNVSLDICVDISNPSATAATSVNVQLSSSATPHLTSYSTQTVTFPANSSSQQCISIPITNNTACGDSNNYTFTLQGVSGGNSATIGTENTTTVYVNDDEGVNGAFKTLSFEASDDWSYSVNNGNGSVNTTLNKYYGTQSYRMGSGHTLTTDNISLAGYTNVSVSVAFASDGVDSGEDLFLDISYNNGASWTGTGSIKLMDGYSNASLNIGDTNALNPTTVSSNPYSVSIALTETQIRLRLRTSSINSTSEYYYIDDIILSGLSCSTVCTPSHSVTGFAPNTGPVGTEVTISGSGFTPATTVRFNGVLSTSVTYVDSSTLIAEVPNGTTTGIVKVEEAGCTINSSNFTIINTAGNCGALSDLIMTEIYDRDGGSLGYIEVYNGTGAPINLTNYFIRRYGDNSELLANNYTDYFFSPGITSIAHGQVVYGKISSDADTASPNFSFGNAGFSGINEEDIFHLYKGSTIIDVYELPSVIDDVGYTARRRLTTTGPNAVSNPSDWTQNNTESTSDLGNFPFTALSNFPSVTAPVDVSSCSATEAQFTVTGSAGSGGTLTYRWYYNDGVSLNWSQVVPGAFPLATVAGQTTNTLTLSGSFYYYAGYQFYCLITEDSTCSKASPAAQLKINATIWDGATWLSGVPDINTIAIIDGDYDTSVGGQQSSFSACQLLVNANHTLFIEDGDYVEVENHLTANGEIIVRTSGAFKQNNNAGIVNGAVLTTPSLIKVEKETAPLNNWYEYTYWSSPVINETVGVALGDSNPNRRFWYNAQNYLDATMETNNDNGTAPGQDDIDDNANDWTLAPATMPMTPGVGFGATHSSLGFGTPGNQYKYTFQGAFNNGVYNVPLYRNDAELNDNNWNLIGNPYPSAISADALLAANAVIDMNVPGGMIDGAIFLWSQNSAPEGTNNGNENLNFAQSDYAIINGTGQAAGGDSVTPSRYIPSGQAFFVSMSNSAPSTVVSGTIRTADFVFNNSMRVLGNNDQFFRNAQGEVPNKLWIDLTSDNGVFNQILVGYVEGATDGLDGMYYDAPKNLSTNANSILYSLPDTDTTIKLAIQGKHTSSLTLDESIPLGFYTSIDEATLFKLSLSNVQGEFLTTHTIYLIDHLLQHIHNLSEGDYTFISEVGEFNDRFEIVFQNQALSVVENEITPNGLSIAELNDGTVRFTVSNNLTIESVQIFDLLGRTLYNLKGSNHSETFDLSNLSQSAYIAKVALSNGQTISKRAVKRK